jgi:hypothetical protein
MKNENGGESVGEEGGGNRCTRSEAVVDLNIFLMELKRERKGVGDKRVIFRLGIAFSVNLNPV